MIDPATWEAAACAVARYVDARLDGDIPAATLPVWTGRSLRGGRLMSVGLDRATEMPRFAERPVITSLHAWMDDFAVARLDEWSTPAASIVTLFKSEDRWLVAGESHASASDGRRNERFDASIAVDDVLRVMETYYRSVDEDDAAPLAHAFHDDWAMKNHEEGAVVSETKDIFMARLGGGRHSGYANDRQVSDVQVIYDCLAYVRVDKPSTPVTTVFTLFREGGSWLIVDKAWTSKKDT